MNLYTREEKKVKVLDILDLQDILVGCTILGTGGGGSLEEGLEAVKCAYVGRIWYGKQEILYLSY